MMMCLVLSFVKHHQVWIPSKAIIGRSLMSSKMVFIMVKTCRNMITLDASSMVFSMSKAGKGIMYEYLVWLKLEDAWHHQAWASCTVNNGREFLIIPGIKPYVGPFLIPVLQKEDAPLAWSATAAHRRKGSRSRQARTNCTAGSSCAGPWCGPPEINCMITYSCFNVLTTFQCLFEEKPQQYR